MPTPFTTQVTRQQFYDALPPGVYSCAIALNTQDKQLRLTPHYVVGYFSSERDADWVYARRYVDLLNALCTIFAGSTVGFFSIRFQKSASSGDDRTSSSNTDTHHIDLRQLEPDWFYGNRCQM